MGRSPRCQCHFPFCLEKVCTVQYAKQRPSIIGTGEGFLCHLLEPCCMTRLLRHKEAKTLWGTLLFFCSHTLGCLSKKTLRAGSKRCGRIYYVCNAFNAFLCKLSLLKFFRFSSINPLYIRSVLWRSSVAVTLCWICFLFWSLVQEEGSKRRGGSLRGDGAFF